MFDEIQNMATEIEIKDELEVDFTEITNHDFQYQNEEESSKIQNECDMIQNNTCDIEIKEELIKNFCEIGNANENVISEKSSHYLTKNSIKVEKKDSFSPFEEIKTGTLKDKPDSNLDMVECTRERDENKCQYCNKVFKRLKSHEIKCKNLNVKQRLRKCKEKFVCQRCNKSFKSKNCLKNHVNSVLISNACVDVFHDKNKLEDQNTTLNHIEITEKIQMKLYLKLPNY